MISHFTVSTDCFVVCVVILGAGKTYTMLGTDSQPGIMVRTLNDLFLEMDKTRGDMAYKVSMAYLEVTRKLNHNVSQNPLQL